MSIDEIVEHEVDQIESTDKKKREELIAVIVGVCKQFADENGVSYRGTIAYANVITSAIAKDLYFSQEDNNTDETEPEGTDV